MTDSFSIYAIDKDVGLFSIGDKSKETVSKVEENITEIAVAQKRAGKLKARFARLRRSVKKRGLGIL